MKKSKTNHGLTIYTFSDCCGDTCSLVHDPYHVNEVRLGMEYNYMVIDRKLAKKLALKLAAFAETG